MIKQTHRWMRGQCLDCSCAIQAFVDRLRGGQIYLCHGKGFVPYDISKRGDHDMTIVKFGEVRKDLVPDPAHPLYWSPVEYCRKCFIWNGTFTVIYKSSDCERRIVTSVMGV